MTRCDLCDFIGPAESGFQGDLLELHRAMHQFGRALIEGAGFLLPQIATHDFGDEMRPTWFSPDCAAGKHTACTGDAWDHENDQPTGCDCTCHQETP